MKVLNVNFEYYYYPESVSDIEEFIEFANSNYNKFIKMVRFETENCVFPYLIGEDVKTVYINIAQATCISEADADVLSKDEYDKRLESVIKTKCINCGYYEEELKNDLESPRGKISLDGVCYGYEEKQSD